jgi:tRNA(His) guanylyltransferase
MRPDDFDRRMRVYETRHDHLVLPGIYMVVRIDGRNFTRLTKEIHPFAAPFDERFRDLMLDAMARAMDCGFRTVYGYSQSDEMSILLHRDEELFERKVRKIDSIMTSEATSAFVLGLGAHAAFDGRVSQLPTAEIVIDYFRWRQADAVRNCLNAHAYWLLRNDGASAREADRALRHLKAPDKHEVLFAHGVNFNDLPAWERRGAGMWWVETVRPAKTSSPMSKPASRRTLHRELVLPFASAYDAFLQKLLGDPSHPG